MNKQTTAALQYAFPKTIPVMVGYLFLGAAYGILMKVNGYGLGWVAASSILIYAGSLQYLEVSLLTGLVNPIYACLMGLMINARHLFYGISMLGKYKDLRRWRTYLIFALTDETFSVLCEETVPEELDKEQVYLWVAALNQGYWVLGSMAGCLIGSMMTFNTRGLDFALTALFVVIFTDQWKGQENHRPALVGLLASAACVVIFGADRFMIPAMVSIWVLLTWDYKRENAGMDGSAVEQEAKAAEVTKTAGTDVAAETAEIPEKEAAMVDQNPEKGGTRL